MVNWRDLIRRPSKKHDDASRAVEEEALAIVPCKRFEDRVAAFESCLMSPVIPLNVFRSLAFNGVPEKNGLRSICWKILLGYMPLDRSERAESLQTQRGHYYKFALELLVNPFQDRTPRAVAVEPVPEQIENPLLETSGGTSERSGVWSQFFDDKYLHGEITKDVHRTHSGIHFFSQQIDYSVFMPRASFGEKGELLDKTKRQFETHHDVISRILLLYAKLNPGVRYVQGMNEILAPIYYVFAQDPDPSFRMHAEPDAFFCFTLVMSELKDRFLASMDGTDSGIGSCIEEYKDVLRRADPELFLHLEMHHVDARYYSLRWFTLLCSQEFHLPDVLRLWDSLFADPYRFDFLQYYCCAMTICIRSRLLSMGYSEMLQTLQRYPQIDMLEVLNKAVHLRTHMTGHRVSFSENIPYTHRVAEGGASNGFGYVVNQYSVFCVCNFVIPHYFAKRGGTFQLWISTETLDVRNGVAMRRQVEAILEEIAALPKVELHRHLDGGIRDQLLFDTARRRNMKLPDAVTCADDLAAYTSAGETCQSLTEFLQTFIFFTPIVRGDRIALRQMALDTCEDLASNNIIYAELRYSPHLLADDNLSASEVVALICDAVREGSARFGIRATTILCAMRHFPEWTSEVVDLAHQFRNNGVVGIDIAGDERHSCLPHRKEFARAKSLGLKITAHASEAGPAHEIVNAVEHLHAERIGHGYHCVHDEAVYKFVRDQRLHLECCVTSSLLTNAVLVPVDQHPVRLFSADGVSFSLSTDDPSVCRTTLNRELQVAAEHVGLSFDDIVRAMVNAAQAAFLPESDRQQLVDTITKHAALAATRILSASPSS